MNIELKERYRYTWVTRGIMKFSSRTGLNPVASSFLLYGLVLLVLPIAGALSNFDFNVILIKPDVYVPAILAYTWILYGPSLVYYFEVKGLPELRAGLENILPRKNIHQVDELIDWFVGKLLNPSIKLSCYIC